MKMMDNLMKCRSGTILIRSVNMKEKVYEEIQMVFEKEQLYRLMLLAHEQDCTLNQLVEDILKMAIKEYK